MRTGCLFVVLTIIGVFQAAASPVASYEQGFESLEGIVADTSSTAEGMSAEIIPDGVTEGSSCLRLRWRSLADNGAVRVTWTFPAADLAGKMFTFWIKPVTEIRYLNIAVMDEAGNRIERHTWFATPAGDWRIMKWWYAAKTFDQSFEKTPTAESTRAAAMMICPGGGPDQECELLIDDLREQADVLTWLIKARPDPVEGVAE